MSLFNFVKNQILCNVTIKEQNRLGRGMTREEQEQIAATLSRNHECYILITCDAPSDNGEMNVQMTYEGDATVAAFLLEGAQSVIAEHTSTLSPSKIVKI